MIVIIRFLKRALNAFRSEIVVLGHYCTVIDDSTAAD